MWPRRAPFSSLRSCEHCQPVSCRSGRAHWPSLVTRRVLALCDWAIGLSYSIVLKGLIRYGPPRSDTIRHTFDFATLYKMYTYRSSCSQPRQSDPYRVLYGLHAVAMPGYALRTRSHFSTRMHSLAASLGCPCHQMAHEPRLYLHQRHLPAEA